MLPSKKLNLSNYHTIFDSLIPRDILSQDYERDYLARRNLLQARAIITVIVSAMLTLIIQLVVDLYLSYKHVKLLHIAWPFSFIGTLICAVILYFIPSGRITISQAAKVGIYFFLSISAYTSCIGTQIQTLSHANFFVVPPFGYIFVSKEFGKQTTIVVCIMHVAAFFRSLGRQINPISLSSSGWVVCDVYILCFIYFLFVAYEQEFQSNQERTQKSLDEARSAATAKSMFISNVSHELRTPLHGILATVEILAKTQLNESQRTLLSAIESCGTNLISVVNQVLTYARIEHNKLELEHNVFDIYTVMQEIGDGLAPIPESKNLDFFVCVEANPLQRFLVGDVGVLRQIILNLLGNAIKFTDKGRIELVTIEITGESKKDGQEQLKRQVITSKEFETIKNSSASVQINSPGQLSENQKDNIRESPKAQFRINVNDTGRGIAPDFISHMYQPFSQEDSSLKRKFEGTGLGLSIVKGLLDMMHSQLEVDSKLGQGSKFSFKLELPISDRLDDMNASPLPFDHKYLKLPPSEQEMLIKRLRSLSYVILNVEEFLLSQKIAHYFDQWEFSYRLLSIDKLKFECTKQHADVVILNDNINDLELFLNEFIQYYRKPKNMGIEEESIDSVMKKRQHVLFFSTIENYQQAETLLMKYKPQSVEIITKPAGPVKILTAIIKTIESSFSKYDGIMKTQEEKIRSIREEYLDFIKSSNNHKISTMDIGPSGELTISPSRLTPPAMIERIISEVSGEDKKTFFDQEQLKEESSMQLKTKGVKNKYKEETEKKLQKSPKDISFLIVEDNKINEMILTTMLKQSGYYNYDIANNGLEAVENFTKKSYDIIFMDLQMPICDGIVATKEIRKIERGEESYLLQSHTSSPKSQSPSDTSAEGTCKIGRRRRKKAIIVAMTGLASDEDSQAAEAAGCNEFLTKPVSIKSLNARMESWTKEALKVDEEAISSEEKND
ncbi:hypothetical protein RhiirA5_498436 [Rhizophagus irregularis]|uniref:Uncharacterized protein n=1 Tax=Rhizophagus irregularis TaxID=588596 RepID=A0A2I1EH91_9GLOM|nr:hypothetical protein RhiirA5_498436 [Rhizophagus irregularis]PKC66172.1 hypothetical protein RhiirA1_535811 [Rhizophagus irregularis]PKY21473.1 hypothetical protein RhiirB3_525049 [Rhizophagus irregularis]CAB4489149.1 unnamed protein product [Rhizophagus irregularis]CAB5213851.1 unnamed protein product [Rhizophagus irregularis]